MRPAMEDVVSKLEEIIKAEEAKPVETESEMNVKAQPSLNSQSGCKASSGITSPWKKGDAIETGLQTFASRIEDESSRQSLQEFQQEVVKILKVSSAIDASAGVYNAARLYRRFFHLQPSQQP